MNALVTGGGGFLGKAIIRKLAERGDRVVSFARSASPELEGLGVRTRIVQKETKAYRDDLRRRDYMMARGGWFGDYGDPTTFLNIHTTGDGNNLRGYSSERFDNLLRQAAAEIDPARRMAILEAAERLTTMEDLPILPLWRYRQFPLYDAERVRGISRHPRAIQRLDYLSLAPEPAGKAEP